MASSLLTIFAAANCKGLFLGFLVTWYQYLPVDGSCNINTDKFVVLGSNSSIPLILLAIVDDLLRIAGLMAVIFVMYAGVRFITSQGSPDETAKARTGIIYALGGLTAAIISISFVPFIAKSLGGAQGGSGAHLNLSVLPDLTGTNPIATLMGIALGIIGAIAVLIIVIGGIKYILAQGDPQATARAKSTIIYALIGLIIVIVAQSIVSLVVHFI